MALSSQGLIGLIFVEKNVDGPFIGRYWKKRPSSNSRWWKIFRNFTFNRMGLRHTWLTWPWIWLKLTSRSASFQTVFRSKKRDWSWLPYSSDLSPLDYFLWGYVKYRRYTYRPTTILALWLLREEPGIFSLVTWNFQRHLEWVVERERGHMENVII